jgi:hypothetical protein
VTLDPNRETELREQVEREFAVMEEASRRADAGVLDVLQVYGGLEVALRQADAYLALLNPTAATFSTSSSSNIPR